MPTQPEATLKRPESSEVMATLKPSPTSPSSASSPTSTPSSASSAVSEALRPELAVDLGAREKPSESVGTTNAASPLCPFSGSVWAKISAHLATLPSEIHCFWPVSFQPPSVFSARVFSDAASEPRVGLGQAEAAQAGPSVSPGMIRCFCSSSPQRAMAEPNSEVHTEITVRAEESTRPISSTISP